MIKEAVIKTLELIGIILSIGMTLCLIAIPVITFAGLVLNHGLIWGSVISLLIVGIVLAIVWNIKRLIRAIKQ